MPRLTRSESQAITRVKLVQAARELFRRDGYSITSVDRIATHAGFSKGAVYSNFPTKDAIFLEVLEGIGTDGMEALMSTLNADTSREAVITTLSNWANYCSGSGSWVLTILEHVRSTTPDSPALVRQRDILTDNWRQLAKWLKEQFPQIDLPDLTLGALLFEIAYAPALTFMKEPTTGELMRIVLERLLPPKP